VRSLNDYCMSNGDHDSSSFLGLIADQTATNQNLNLQHIRCEIHEQNHANQTSTEKGWQSGGAVPLTRASRGEAEDRRPGIFLSQDESAACSRSPEHEEQRSGGGVKVSQERRVAQASVIGLKTWAGPKCWPSLMALRKIGPCAPAQTLQPQAPDGRFQALSPKPQRRRRCRCRRRRTLLICRPCRCRCRLTLLICRPSPRPSCSEGDGFSGAQVRRQRSPAVACLRVRREDPIQQGNQPPTPFPLGFLH
jgi:hypothetical protein